MFQKLAKTLKKAFTITELVIVIAVIAVLAAVLIPTFSNVISSANQSAALSTCNNALTDLAGMAANEGKTSEDLYGTGFSRDGYYYVFFMNQLWYLGEIDTGNSKIEEIGDNVAELGYVVSGGSDFADTESIENPTYAMTDYILFGMNYETKPEIINAVDLEYGEKYGDYEYTLWTQTNYLILTYTLVINSTYYVGMFEIEVGTSSYTPTYQTEGANYSKEGYIVAVSTTLSAG